jgi:hypothetical protein
MTQQNGIEAGRLRQAYAAGNPIPWLQWGPYLSERQWGTVREDYSAGGNAWDYFPHDQSRSRAYRWGEDGLAGISDDDQQLCFALALWNGRDPILKERLFGLTNSEGNHGEDVKEYYYYLDNTPTHSYMKWLYKYPQRPFPYESLIDENSRRKQTDPRAFEYELLDTGVFADDRFFDAQVEYAKASPSDILIKITLTNHGPDKAPLTILPTIWFRNTWSWFREVKRPELTGRTKAGTAFATIHAAPMDGSQEMMLYCQSPDSLLFVQNESNNERLWGSPNQTPHPKDGINDHVIHGKDTVNPQLTGSKASALYAVEIEPGKSVELRLRLTSNLAMPDPFGADFGATFTDRLAEADAFYTDLAPPSLTEEQKMIQRQAYAGMLWSKQFYHYIVSGWLDGDSVGPPPPQCRGRNADWRHLYVADVLSMPDKWEYPWFASWDLCFHTVVFSRLDPQFAKEQLKTLAHEWYMSPDGAIPAYEWSFSDVNPPLHAWAALRIFEIEKEMTGGEGDAQFLADIFGHCLMNFTWWANQEDPEHNSIFEGGFLGLDNISVINRSNLQDFESQLGRHVTLFQSDGTSWMGMFCLNMMEIALKLSALGKKGYIDFAIKFVQHFVFIADALNDIGRRSDGKIRIWDDEDGFYYDFLKVDGSPDQYASIKLRSLVGIIALFPVSVIDLDEIEKDSADAFRERMDWFMGEHPELLDVVTTGKAGNEHRLLLSYADPSRLVRILSRVFDEMEFLSPHGIRGISQEYRNQPFTMTIDSATLTEQYAPAESADGTFGGNSNWRGPVWFPINFMLIEKLRSYHDFVGDDFLVEYPTRSGNRKNLREIADDLSSRMISIFERNHTGHRPVYGGNDTLQSNPKWQNLLLFFEYFHGDNGAGIGASHQTGWTGLVAELLQQTTTKKQG